MKYRFTLTALKRKLSGIVHRSIPRKQHFRPSGVHEAAGTDSNVIYTKVYGQYPNPLDVDPSLIGRASEFHKPRHESDAIDYYVAQVPHGRISSANPASVAIITRSNELVGDVSLNYAKGGAVSPELNNIFRQKYFPDPKEIDGTVFSALTGGGAAVNYGHWLLDCLSRVHLLKASGKFAEVTHFLVPRIKYDYQEDSLRMVGIRRNQLLEAQDFVHIKAREVIACTSPRGLAGAVPAWLCEFYRDAVLGSDSLPAFDAPRIYLRRSDASIRNVTNEDDVVRALRTLGFRDFELSKLRFEEKAALFAQADIVVSPVSAGLVNIMFCKQDAKVIELQPDVYIETIFADIAAKLGIHYEYQMCQSEAAAGGGHLARRANVTIDVENLIRLLKSLVN